MNIESHPTMPSLMSSHTVRNRCLRFMKQMYQGKFNWHQHFTRCRAWAIGLIICALLLWWFGLTNLNPAKLNSESVLDHSLRSNNESQNHKSQGNQLDLKLLGMIYNESDRHKKEEGYTKHAFNILISERLGLYRALPDTRNELCRTKKYDLGKLSSLNTSIIICFYNEDFDTLQRTIYTVLKRTPAQLLKEIILVDDHSDNDTPARIDDHKKKEGTDRDYVDKVRHLRTPERAGLIRARLYGNNFATGQVLFFLDSHCEMNDQWLEPLLERIAQNRKLVVCPIIDLINPDTFAYSPSPIVKGGFNWGLHFKWDSVPSELLSKKEDFIKPITSPTMAGGLFAMDRRYFNELGTYDRGMDIWGGENIEISFRIWMCGGQLEIIPCSRVGHVFRHRRPYGSPEGTDTLAYNSLRVAHVWMDDYKKYYLASRSDLVDMNYGNIDDRIELRRRLNCSSFEWYLQNIYPGMLTPEQEKQKAAQQENAKKINTFDRKPQKVINKFAIQMAGTELCLESESEITYKGARLYLKPCLKTERRQHWKETALHDIRLGPKSCLEALQGKPTLRLSKCHEMGGTQEWQLTQFKDNITQIYNSGSGMCLAAKSEKPLKDILDKSSDIQLIMTLCNTQNQTNSWVHVQWRLNSF